MTEIGLLKMGHLLCLVYWLGADLGVFYSSYFVANEKLSPETRVTISKILFALDQGPRICMTLILPLGVHLAYRLGLLPVSGGVVVGAWVLCLGWLTMVLTLHAKGHTAARLAVVDYWFRIALAAGLATAGVYALTSNILAGWLAAKIIVFAALVACGLFVRRKLRPFGPAFAGLVSGNPSDQDNAAIRNSLAGTRPFVVAIWIGLLINTALGLHLL